MHEVSDEKNDDDENIASLASDNYKIVRTVLISHDASSEGNKTAVLVLLWGRG